MLSVPRMETTWLTLSDDFLPIQSPQLMGQGLNHQLSQGNAKPGRFCLGFGMESFWEI